MSEPSVDPLPSAYDIPLEKILPINARLFSEHRWHEYFARLREEDPVHFNETDLAGRFWSLTRYDDIKKVDPDWQNFSSAHGITLGFPVHGERPEGMLDLSTFIAQDPPEHDVKRKSVQGAVAPANLAKMESLIRERTCAVLDSLPENETFDWVDTVSIELTTMMLATLFDFPFEERRKLTRWSDITFAIPQPGGIVESDKQRQAELLECLDAFTKLKEERLLNPGNDLVSMLAHGADTKDMPPMEYLGNLRRTANHDCELGGKQILAGDQILMWYVSGNRDDAVFDHPDELNIERHNARAHLSFGFGIHRCMGNRLAELQLRVLWEEILARFEKIEVQDEPERTFSSFVNGYTHLPVRVRRKQA